VEANRVVNGLHDLSDESIDLFIVDGLDRMQCVREGAAKVRRGGVLVLDDSDLPEHAEADTLLSGWRVERFVGLKQSPLLAVETSVYEKP
jgi:hypothetical protein